MSLAGCRQEAIEEVAGYLNMPPIAVFEVATFYSMYNVKPLVATRLRCVRICRARCRAQRGGLHLKQQLGIGFGDTTADGEFTLKEGECLGACGDAPVLLVNNKRMESFMSNDKLDALLSELKRA